MSEESAEPRSDRSESASTAGEAILDAVEAGEIGRVRTLLEEHPGECLHARDATLQATPLHVAAGANRAEIAGLLLLYGAEIDPRDYQGMTPLH